MPGQKGEPCPVPTPEDAEYRATPAAFANNIMQCLGGQENQEQLV